MSSIVSPAASGKRLPAFTVACRALGRALFRVAAVLARVGLASASNRLALVALRIVQAGERRRLAGERGEG